MTNKKLLEQHIYWAECLSEFNFVISYNLDKEIRKIDLFIRQLNDCLAND